jgi:hypothetical protein
MPTLKAKKKKGKLTPGKAAGKLKPITITFVTNPVWKKQMALVKRELIKLNKTPMLIIK